MGLQPGGTSTRGSFVSLGLGFKLWPLTKATGVAGPCGYQWYEVVSLTVDTWLISLWGSPTEG